MPYTLIGGPDRSRSVELLPLEGTWLSTTDFEAATGWQVKPEGFCKDDACIPAGDAVEPDAVDLAAFADLCGRPLVVDRAEEAVSLGAASRVRTEQLSSLQAPDFTLPDLNGAMHSLSDYRGSKVLLAAYASW